MDRWSLVTDERIKQATGWDRGKIAVYLVNGRDPRIGEKLHLRRPIKRDGKWGVRDNGWVPLTRTDGNVFLT